MSSVQIKKISVFSRRSSSSVVILTLQTFLWVGVNMEIENDPNVVYGGDLSDLEPIKANCASLGEVIFRELKKGGNKTSLVRLQIRKHCQVF